MTAFFAGGCALTDPPLMNMVVENAQRKRQTFRIRAISQTPVLCMVTSLNPLSIDHVALTRHPIPNFRQFHPTIASIGITMTKLVALRNRIAPQSNRPPGVQDIADKPQ